MLDGPGCFDRWWQALSHQDQGEALRGLVERVDYDGRRCVNSSGGSKPSYRERQRVGAGGAARTGRYGEMEAVFARRRERVRGG